MAGRPKGQRKTGGRKRGSKNKRTIVTENAAREGANKNLTPLQYFLRMMRDPRQPKEDRKWAAAQAAPYMHSRLQATEIRNPDGEELVIRVVR